MVAPDRDDTMDHSLQEPRFFHPKPGHQQGRTQSISSPRSKWKISLSALPAALGCLQWVPACPGVHVECVEAPGACPELQNQFRETFA